MRVLDISLVAHWLEVQRIKGWLRAGRFDWAQSRRWNEREDDWHEVGQCHRVSRGHLLLSWPDISTILIGMAPLDFSLLRS